MVDVPKQDRDLKLPAIQVNGRTYVKYDPTIALDVVERVADGELLTDICNRQTGPVSKSTFLKWVATVPEVAKAYAAAQQLSALSFEEAAIKKAQATAMAPGSTQNVAAANLLVSQYRWSAARRNPTKYSDKGNTSIVVPVNITSSLNLGTSKQSIDVEVPDMYTIHIPGKEEDTVDAEFTELNSEREVEPAAPLVTKDTLKEILHTDKPVIGVSHQPLFAKNKKPNGFQPGPRKRVLVPRAPKEKK